MLSETLTDGLQSYRIGAKLRTLRLRKNLGLKELSAHTALSTAMLSKIERGQLFPTLPTLLRIAMVFGVGLEHFFSGARERSTMAIVRKGDRLRLPDTPDDTHPAYFFESLNFPFSRRPMDAYIATFPAAAKPSVPHAHAGTELLFVIAGRVTLSIDNEAVTLAQGDAVYFESGATHCYQGDAEHDSTALVAAIAA